MKKVLFVLIASAYVLVGCNTMAGMGQDVQKAGEKVEDGAKKKDGEKRDSEWAKLISECPGSNEAERAQEMQKE